MKTIVSVQEISEFDIKPPEALQHWKGLSESALKKLVEDRSSWVTPAWPTCPPDAAKPAFSRLGFDFVESPSCGSLYAQSRPSEKAIWSWYRESDPARYWRERILPASELPRREKITRPRADWILDGISEYAPQAKRLVDVSTHCKALIDTVAEEQSTLREIVAAGMTADLEGSLHSRVHAQPTRLSSLSELGKTDVVVAIDVLDRASDVSVFLTGLQNLLSPGGVLFLTAAVSSGFEIQTLWDKSNTVSLPDKLNLPSVDALQKFFPNPAWEILELSTPGMFDVDMVLRAMIESPEHNWPRVVRSLVQQTDASGRMALVELLQSRRMASFARLVVRRNA